MFLKEVMRLYPPVFFIARKTTKPIHFPRGFGEDQNCLDETPVIKIYFFNSKVVSFSLRSVSARKKSFTRMLFLKWNVN